MFDSIGWGEILVVALAALFIFGPERLPGLAKDAASGLKRVRAAITEIREQVNDSLGEDLPELRDLDLRKYHPKTFIRKHVLSDEDQSLFRSHAEDLRRELNDALKDPRKEVSVDGYVPVVEHRTDRDGDGHERRLHGQGHAGHRRHPTGSRRWPRPSSPVRKNRCAVRVP